ncbi:Dyp-type peroxidase [Bradyrhizobium sp. CCGUVB1N3]|uniref:Dyp-type peroxidase n=1 Tax=Bradyrhizobium sp. CCGUVB1N3 TaxID=2949629 RepID=UPI0020B1D590|nr:Dyp-type peroxidase domain-containing protein [Bradyrhizobium sp. CCGUVB1N3]MCP3470408.1 Dyp-type peroxidase [Bradyrhizobium sp. CCGUVB1N3]
MKYVKHAPHLSKQRHDIQGMLKSGFGWLKSSRFWLLTIRDGREDRARAWLAQLANSGLVVSAKRVGEGKAQSEGSISEAVAVAFSFSGLKKLGCSEAETHPFPTPFSSGMGSALRKELLRDTSRDQWRWSDVEDDDGRQTVHVLVAQWWVLDEKSRMEAPDPDVFIVRTVENNPCSFKSKGDGRLREPFGFRDGLAQPVIRGLREEGGAARKQAERDAGHFFEDRVVEPGEFILGYRNEYDELTYCPNVKEWPQSGDRFTLNGSYLAVRQIEQNVEAFEEFRKANGQGVCEKLMGRRMDGMPLGWQGPPGSDSAADAFRYRVEDANGFVCPKGAHVRRSNPRDSLGIDVQSSIKSSKLHRLLRRGRPYREETESGTPRDGLFFIACNADLERQFEFMHQRWVQNPRFGTLDDQDDPVVGSQPVPKTFTIPGLPSGSEVTLASFTQPLGGGYFFLPGIAALNFIVGHRAGVRTAAAHHAEAAVS